MATPAYLTEVDEVVVKGEVMPLYRLTFDVLESLGSSVGDARSSPSDACRQE